MTTSYELPFSRPGGWSIQKVILLGLIAVHAVWIVIHLNLVSRELINPWKLGGYGMYTVPSPAPQVYLGDNRFNGFEINVSDQDHAQLVRENNFFVFRCRPMKITSITGFLKKNPRLVGVPLVFIVTEKAFARDPIRTERLRHAVLEIRWTGQSTFDYAGKVCGKPFRGEAELKP